jgi:putative membrane protein
VLLLARIILAIAINMLALWVANVLWDSVNINGFWAYFIGAVVLGIANAVIKPILAILTLPLIVLTLGIFYLFINILMVLLAEWIAPNFSIDGFWTYVGVVFIIWLVNWVASLAVDLFDRPRERYA